MARRRKRRTLKPRVPKRVKTRKKRERKTRGHQHPELIGLGLVALGVFLVAVLWAGWNGDRLRLARLAGRAGDRRLADGGA